MKLTRITLFTLALVAPALAQDRSSQAGGDATRHGHDATTSDTGAQKDKAAPVPKGSKKSKNGDPKTP